MLVLKNVKFKHFEQYCWNPGEPTHECCVYYGEYQYECYEPGIGYRYTLSLDIYNGVPCWDGREPSQLQCESKHKSYMHDEIVIYLNKEEIAQLYKYPILFFKDYLMNSDEIKHPYIQTVLNAGE